MLHGRAAAAALRSPLPPALRAPVPRSVPLKPKDAAKKAEALRHKAMQSTQPQGSGLEVHHSGLGRLLDNVKTKLRLPLVGGGDVERAGAGADMQRTASADEAAGEGAGWGGAGQRMALCSSTPRLASKLSPCLPCPTCSRGGRRRLCGWTAPGRACT